MIAAVRIALGLLSASVSIAATAQPVIDIELGQTKTQKAGTTTDIYRFFGGSGTTIKATLTAPGKSVLILYTPAGEEMLSARESGSVTLEAILPLWDVFYVAVIREKAATPYSLKLIGQEPSAAQAMLAYKVGFTEERGGVARERCWIEPGVTRRSTWESTVAVTKLDSDSRLSTRFFTLDGKPEDPFTMVQEIKGVGDDVQWVTDNVADARSPPLSSFIGAKVGQYLGMTCDNQFDDWL